MEKKASDAGLDADYLCCLEPEKSPTRRAKKERCMTLFKTF